jgi:hypothetical protein
LIGNPCIAFVLNDRIVPLVSPFVPRNEYTIWANNVDFAVTKTIVLTEQDSDLVREAIEETRKTGHWRSDRQYDEFEQWAWGIHESESDPLIEHIYSESREEVRQVRSHISGQVQ